MIIKNALIYTPRHTFEEGSLTIREGRIVPFAQPEEGEEIVDAKGAYALPGLVDIHFHGAMGKDFCDGTEEAIQTLADYTVSEAQIENLVTAKGYADCVAFISDGSASVVVSATEEGLTDADVARITEIVTDETGFEASSIKIIEAQP